MEGVSVALSLFDTPEEFRLKTLEAIGWLVYCVHRNRGRLNWLTNTHATSFVSNQGWVNWKNLNILVDKWERWIWEIAPPRAILWDMGVWRRTGKLKEDIGWLLNRDVYGRKPSSSNDPLHRESKTLKKTDIDTLVDALGVRDELVFRLRVLEALGLLTMAIHKNRGRMNWLLHAGAVSFPTTEGRKNWETLDKGVADTEAILWEIVPPRALIQEMHAWRKSGRMPKDIRKLLERTDSHGRSPWMGSYEGLKKQV